MKFFSPWGLALIVIIVLILFGPRRLPDLGKSFRRSMTAFKEELDDTADDEHAEGDRQTGTGEQKRDGSSKDG